MWTNISGSNGTEWQARFRAIDSHSATSGLCHIGSDTKATQNLWLLPVACSKNSGFLSPAHWYCGQGPYWGQVGLGTWDSSHSVDVTSSKWLNLAKPQHLHLKNGDYMCLFVWGTKMDTVSFLSNLCQNVWPNPITRKHQTKPNWRRVYKVNGLLLFKHVKVMKGEDRLRNNSRLKETKDTWPLSAKHDTGLEPKPGKKINI